MPKFVSTKLNFQLLIIGKIFQSFSFNRDNEAQKNYLSFNDGKIEHICNIKHIELVLEILETANIANRQF